MPEMDGIQLARAIRERARLQATRLFLLTSLGQRSVCDSLKRLDVAACMVKPVRREHLFLTIARISGTTKEGSAGGDGSAPHGQKGVAESIGHPARELSVLVAEDNAINQRVLTGMLKRLGHRYELVADGEAVIEAVKRSAYDIVLMDCQMLGIDGLRRQPRFGNFLDEPGKFRSWR